jgi:hypothetical protein
MLVRPCPQRTTAGYIGEEVFWFVRLLALRPLLAYCASLGWWLWRSRWNVNCSGETEVLGENMPQRHFCPSQNPTWPDPGLSSGRRGGKPATNRLSYGAALQRSFAEFLFMYLWGTRKLIFWNVHSSPFRVSDWETCLYVISVFQERKLLPWEKEGQGGEALEGVINNIRVLSSTFFALYTLGVFSITLSSNVRTSWAS